MAPINLTLLTRWGLKPEQGPVCVPLDFAQRGHTPLHGLVTAGIAAACPQLLIQNPRRVPDLWGAGLHKVGMGGQERLRDHRPLVWAPGRLSQTAAYGLAIQVQSPPNLRNGHALLIKQPPDLRPPFLIHHARLPRLVHLDAHDRRLARLVKSHLPPPSGRGWGEFNDHIWGLLNDR